MQLFSSCPNDFQIMLATMSIQGWLPLAWFGGLFIYSFQSSWKHLDTSLTLNLQVFPLVSMWNCTESILTGGKAWPALGVTSSTVRSLLCLEPWGVSTVQISNLINSFNNNHKHYRRHKYPKGGIRLNYVPTLSLWNIGWLLRDIFQLE